MVDQTVYNITNDQKQIFLDKLGQQLMTEACANFELFNTAQEESDAKAGTLKDEDQIAGLLMTLGVELDEYPEELSLKKLLEILCEQVEGADPVDGICTELADRYDSEFTGECTLENLQKFLDEESWFGADPILMQKKLQGIVGSQTESIQYKDAIKKLVSE